MLVERREVSPDRYAEWSEKGRDGEAAEAEGERQDERRDRNRETPRDQETEMGRKTWRRKRRESVQTGTGMGSKRQKQGDTRVTAVMESQRHSWREMNSQKWDGEGSPDRREDPKAGGEKGQRT